MGQVRAIIPSDDECVLFFQSPESGRRGGGQWPRSERSETSNKIKHIHQVYIYNSPFYLGGNFKNNSARKSQLLQVLDYVSQSINTVSVIATSKTSYVRRNTGDDPSVGHPSLPPPPLDNPKIDNSLVPKTFV